VRGVRTPNAVVSLGIKFVGEKSPPVQQNRTTAQKQIILHVQRFEYNGQRVVEYNYTSVFDERVSGFE
jgi:hypothetical protein